MRSLKRPEQWESSSGNMLTHIKTRVFIPVLRMEDLPRELWAFNSQAERMVSISESEFQKVKTCLQAVNDRKALRRRDRDKRLRGQFLKEFKGFE